jgi:hypothetical protein
MIMLMMMMLMMMMLMTMDDDAHDDDDHDDDAYDANDDIAYKDDNPPNNLQSYSKTRHICGQFIHRKLFFKFLKVLHTQKLNKISLNLITFNKSHFAAQNMSPPIAYTKINQNLKLNGK